MKLKVYFIEYLIRKIVKEFGDNPILSISWVIMVIGNFFVL